MLEENLFLLQTVGNCRKLSKNVENLSKTVNHCLKMSEKVERSGIQKTPYKNAQLSSTCPRAGSSSPRTIFGRRHADTEPPSPHTSFIIFSRFFYAVLGCIDAISMPYRRQSQRPKVRSKTLIIIFQLPKLEVLAVRHTICREVINRQVVIFVGANVEGNQSAATCFSSVAAKPACRAWRSRAPSPPKL